jgi:hypothetical protein
MNMEMSVLIIGDYQYTEENCTYGAVRKAHFV